MEEVVSAIDECVGALRGRVRALPNPLETSYSYSVYMGMFMLHIKIKRIFFLIHLNLSPSLVVRVRPYALPVEVG